jgi:phage baseplate assembly protein W
LANFMRHAIIEGDTLQQLSQRYLDDVNRWVELAVLNELEYPFIVDDTRGENTPDNVKALGELILIPMELSDLIENLPKYELQEGYDRLLGEDISLFDFRDTINLGDGYQGEMEANNRGDLKTVKGIQNLKQAIMIRLCTPLGSLLHHPNFGSRIQEYLGQKDTFQNTYKIKLEIERVIRGDERVSDIVIETFKLTFGRIDVNLKITAIGIDEVVNMGVSFDSEGVIEWA